MLLGFPLHHAVGLRLPLGGIVQMRDTRGPRWRMVPWLRHGGASLVQGAASTVSGRREFPLYCSAQSPSLYGL